jgi:hypothetical protein
LCGNSRINIAEPKSIGLIVCGPAAAVLRSLARARLGIADHCYFRSAFICRVLRRRGIDARLNFGTMKENDPSQNDWHYSGHCWVTFGNDIEPSNYPFVIQYPFNGDGAI